MAFTRSWVRFPSPPIQLMSEDLSSGKLDPEIAGLMGISQQSSAAEPQFNELFRDEKAAEKGEPEAVDLTKQRFEPIVKTSEDAKPFFKDKDYYKKLLSAEGDISKRVHQLLCQFLNAKDPKDKSLHRARLTPAFWDLGSSIATRCGGGLALPKLLLLRLGVLSPTLISQEQRDMISRIIIKNNTGEPVHYTDEWLQKVATGSVSPSATDEVKQSKQNADQKIRDRIEKKHGQRQSELALLKNKITQLEQFEAGLLNHSQSLRQHQTRLDYGGLKDCYTVDQKQSFTEISTILRQLSNLDRDIKASYTLLDSIDREIREMSEKSEGADARSFVDRGTVIGEFNSLRQMSKLCVGRQGNHFPILMKQYFRPHLREIGTRENVITIMAEVEQLDPELFHRTFKGQTNRIVPHVLLLPNYGECGICWEPFERFNRASSRGRIAIPIFPKNLRAAIIAALGDLRWQVAKEKAQHYWMEEGITGRYYQWFQSKKLRGDVREYFIQDYILWIAKESQGTQKLDREIRGLFWRMMPFPQAVKDVLRNRGFVYNDLYKKDINISRSDGY